MKPVILLRQHIGEIRNRLKPFYDSSEYHNLIKLGCTVTDGVIVYHKKTGVQFTPTSIVGDFRQVSLQSPTLLCVVLHAYQQYLSIIPEDLVKYAEELGKYKDELEASLVKEQFYPGGQLWWRSVYGIHRIEIINVTRYHNPRIKFKDLDSPNQEIKEGLAVNFSLFYRKENALNPEKEGKYIDW